MKDGLKPGITMTRRIDITKDNTIAFMGEDLRVYATPAMVLDIEHLCRDMIFEYCGEGEDSVGAHVSVDHLGPTLLGMWVEVTVTVTEVDGPKVVMETEVLDALDTVGRGTHVRYVIDMARQKKRLEGKAAKFAELA